MGNPASEGLGFRFVGVEYQAVEAKLIYKVIISGSFDVCFLPID